MPVESRAVQRGEEVRSGGSGGGGCSRQQEPGDICAPLERDHMHWQPALLVCCQGSSWGGPQQPLDVLERRPIPHCSRQLHGVAGVSCGMSCEGGHGSCGGADREEEGLQTLSQHTKQQNDPSLISHI